MYKSFLWDFFSRFSNQLISFVVSVFLTRLLLPEEFGIMGIALVVISFSTLFVDLGFGRAIIQQKDITDTQLSTVFFLNFSISLLFSLICFLLAYPAATFFGQPLVKPVLQVLSLSFIFYGLNVVPTALLYREMKFRVTSVISTAASLLSGIVGIYMAKQGYGVWSLVGQNLSAGFLIFFFTFLYLRWIPKLLLFLPGIKSMWTYSSRLFLSALLDTAFMRLDIFIIGKLFSTTTLGYYTRAQSMDNIIKQISSTSIVAVLFPFLSKYQTETAKINALYRRYLHIISFLAFFLSGVLYISADSIFTILFSSRWAESAALFKIMTIASFVYPVSALMVNILSARGNSTAFLKAEIYKKLIILPAYIFGFVLGLHGFVFCLALSYILALFVNAFFVKKEIDISMLDQFKIVFMYGLISAIIVMVITFLEQMWLPGAMWPRLLLQASLFTLLFILAHAVTQTDGFRLITGKIKIIFRK